MSEDRAAGTPESTVLLPSFSFSLICYQLSNTASASFATASP